MLRFALAAILALVAGLRAVAADVPATGGYGANQASRVAPVVTQPDAMPQERNALSWAATGRDPTGRPAAAYNQPPAPAAAPIGTAPEPAPLAPVFEPSGAPVRPAAHTDPLPLLNGVPGAGAAAEVSDEPRAAPPTAPPSANPATRRGGIPLGPPSRDKSAPDAAPRTTSATGSIVTVATSLAIVLGLFFLAIWFLRRGLPGGPPQLPSDAVAVLGQLPLTGRQTLHLVRLGGKLILICSNGEETATLTEITELAEVERIAATCASIAPTGSTATFRDLLTQMSSEPAPAGFLGESGRPSLAATYGGQDDE